MRRGAGYALLVLLAAVSLGDVVAAEPRTRALRPNLRPLAPGSFISPRDGVDPNYTFGGSFTVGGCTADEVARKLARRCLRFDSALANLGRGPLEVAYLADADPAHPGPAAYQRIYRTDDSYKSRFAIETEYHPTHLHFHIKDMYVAKMWKVNKRQRVVGDEPLARSDKNGFCPEDTAPYVASAPDPNYSCFGGSGAGSDGALQVVGITAGWADVYPHYLPDQYIEIDGLKNGRYLFELEVDPNNVFVESSETDNRVCVLLELQGSSASTLGERKCPALSS